MRTYAEFSQTYFPAIDELCKSIVADDGVALAIACRTMAEMSELYYSYSDEENALAAFFGQARANCVKDLQMTAERMALRKRVMEMDVDYNIWKKGRIYVWANWVLLCHFVKACLRGELREFMSGKQADHKALKNLK